MLVALSLVFGAEDVAAKSPKAGAAGPMQAAPDADPDVATIYRGVLGEMPVQLTLSVKADDPAELIGEYFVFGGGRNFQLAGEIDNDSVYLEESDDGVRISGSWEGKLVVEASRAFIVGTWHNADETRSLAFKLERVLGTRSLLKRSS